MSCFCEFDGFGRVTSMCGAHWEFVRRYADGQQENANLRLQLRRVTQENEQLRASSGYSDKRGEK
jgi:hypothetical protein